VATIEPSRVVVCDAGPLIHLDELDALDLLSDFAAVLVPGAVWGEVLRHRPRALDGSNCRLTRCATTQPAGSRLQSVARAFLLDAGEWEALLVLEERPDAILLTDDAAARLAARALGYRAHGTLGILLRAVRREQRSRRQILDLLRELPSRSTLHLSADLLNQIVAEVEALPSQG